MILFAPGFTPIAFHPSHHTQAFPVTAISNLYFHPGNSTLIIACQNVPLFFFNSNLIHPPSFAGIFWISTSLSILQPDPPILAVYHVFASINFSLTAAITKSLLSGLPLCDVSVGGGVLPTPFHCVEELVLGTTVVLRRSSNFNSSNCFKVTIGKSSSHFFTN